MSPLRRRPGFRDLFSARRENTRPVARLSTGTLPGAFWHSSTRATKRDGWIIIVLGAVAELERSLIVERVKAGLRNAKAKGKRLGRPKRVVDARKLAGLRAQGFGWKEISREMGIGVGTLYRLAAEGSKIREKVF
jgi:DNA invertase Pin-like site-specific DNA recombinase